MSNNTLNRLEFAAIELLLRGEHPALAVLRQQVEHSRVARRELTGAGFFTELAVDRSVPAAQVAQRTIRLRDVEADLEGLEHGAGFILLVEDGFLRSLEGYSYEEPWPATIGGFAVRYAGTERDLRELGPSDTVE
jgi:hypothetical protein